MYLKKRFRKKNSKKKKKKPRGRGKFFRGFQEKQNRARCSKSDEKNGQPPTPYKVEGIKEEKGETRNYDDQSSRRVVWHTRPTKES